MSEATQLISNYNEIRQRLRYPPNAVLDIGIDLKRKRIPQSEVLECVVDKTAVVVNVTEVRPPVRERVGLKLADIERAVCEHFRITSVTLHTRRRHKQYTYPRHILWYLACKHTTLSLPMIGRKHNHSYDHTTILHARDKISEMLLVDSRTAGIVRHIEFMLFGVDEPKADQPNPPLATVPKLDMAEKQTISLPQLEIRIMD